jgi:transposase-like protein
MTQADLARKHGIKPTALARCRRRYGVSAMEAVEIVLIRQKHVSGAELCRRAGVDYEAVKYVKSTRGLHDWSEAIAIYQGRKANMIKTACEEAGVSANSVYALRSQQGMTTEQAIQYLQTKKDTGAVAAAAERHGVPVSSVYHRMRRGLSPEEAAKVAAKFRNRTMIKDRCIAAGVSYKRVYTLRCLHAITTDEAIARLKASRNA